MIRQKSNLLMTTHSQIKRNNSSCVQVFSQVSLRGASFATKQSFRVKKIASPKKQARNDTKRAHNVNSTVALCRPKSIILLQGVFAADIFDQFKQKESQDVFVLEGRPDLRSAATSCRELLKRKISPTLISDNMAGFLFFKNLVKETWIAYQTSTSEGALCHIGALIVGVLGKKHNVPVYLFPAKGPTKLLGSEKDLLSFKNKKTAPKGIRGYVPLTEWLPNKYITKIF